MIKSKNFYSLCFHSLLGNLFFLEPLYTKTLETFCYPRKLRNKEKDSEAISKLAKVSYLVDENLDERKIIEKRNKEWMEVIPNGGHLCLLNLIISETCNLACSHCLHRCSVDTNTSHGSKKIMDWLMARKTIDLFTRLMDKWNRQNYSVSFGSAEPLINWDVFKKSVIYLKQINSEIKLTINTNLVLMDIEKAKFLRDNKVFISTSLDGPKYGNDLIRNFPDGRGTYKKILANFKLLADIGYPLDGFSITINDLNFDYVDSNFIDWAASQGFKGIATDIDLINTLNSSRSIKDCVDKLLGLRKSCQINNLENFGSWTTAYHSLVNGSDDGMPTFCKAIKGNNISVNPEGKLFICGHTTTLLGNIDYFKEVFFYNSPYYKLVESRLPGNDLNCFDCQIEGACAGQCQITREVAKTTGNGRDSFLCEFYRTVTFALLKEKLKEELKDNSL